MSVAPTEPTAGDVPEGLFRDAMSRFASGVTIVTTRAPDGRPYGFTASSFASLSLHPPLVLVCMGNRSSAYEIFMQADRFAVSVLAEGQEDLAHLFSRPGQDRFGDPAVKDGPLGLPVADGALARMHCAMDSRLPSGDHAILIGRPQWIDVAPGRPLVHYDRRLGGLDGGVFP
jgi:flavin reductase ActVB